MQEEKIEIASLTATLNGLSESGFLNERTANACAQAALLLGQFRETVAATWQSKEIPMSDADAMDRLRLILAKQGEG